MTTISTNVLRHRQERQAPHLAVQILGILAFTGFAIVTTVLAFVMFWLAGVILTLAFVWFGFRFMLSPRHRAFDEADFAPISVTPARSSNTSFNTYRDDVLRRLEDEQASFEGFLGRLREAKDAREFDSFMEERAQSNRAAALTDDADDAPKRGEY
jgi:hypothetical protein